ncbi:MAG: hypothetical protein ACJ71T_12625 [Actinomycetales bacterium]
MKKQDAAGLTLHFDPDGALLESTLDCEYDVFAERYGEDRSALEHYHSPFYAASTFLSLADSQGDVVAMARLVYPSPAGLITTRDVAGEPWNVDARASLAAAGLDPARTWDVSTVCARKSSRGQTALLAAAIYHGLIKTMRANRVDGFTAMLDARIHRILNMLGVVMHPLPGVETLPFWGSPATTPAYANFNQLIDGQRRMSPDAYRLVTLGVGLDGIRIPDNEAFVLHRPRSVTLPQITQRTVDLAASAAGSAHPEAVELAHR